MRNGWLLLRGREGREWRRAERKEGEGKREEGERERKGGKG